MDASLILKTISFLLNPQLREKIICVSQYNNLEDVFKFYINDNINLYYLDAFFDYDLSLNFKKFLAKTYNNQMFIFINKSLEEKDLIDNFKKLIFENLDKLREKNISVVLYLDHNYPYFIHIPSFSSEFRKLLFSKVENKEYTNIHYIGQIGTSGYAVAAVRYIVDFIMKGYNVSWKPLLFDNTPFDLTNWINLLASNVINKEVFHRDTVILHSTPNIWTNLIEENKLKEFNNIIGYFAWESNFLPETWVNQINTIEEISEIRVPSTFNKEVLINSGITKNINIDPHKFINPGKIPNKNNVTLYDCYGNKIPDDKFTFYSIGEYISRKGIDDLVKIFNKFHRYYKDTQLVLKLNYRMYHSESINYIIKSLEGITNLLGRSIFVIYKPLSDIEMLSIHSFCDCYISLTRGEGFGLPIFDAYNLKKNIIVTGYGGQLDYLGKDYKGLIDYKLLPVNENETMKFNDYYRKNQKWAYPILEHAYSLMEQFYIESL